MAKKHRNGKLRRRTGNRHTRAMPSVQVHTRPGSIHTPPDAEQPLLRFTAYGRDSLLDKQNCTIDQIRAELGKHPVIWIDACGLGDAAVIQELGDALKLHPLALEDLVSIPLRSKVEDFPHHLFAVTQIASYESCLDTDQVSVFVGRSFVLTWRERPGKCFDIVRKRLQVTGGVTRSSGVDYLLYVVLDAVIDTYFPALERIGEILDDLDDHVEAGADLSVIARMRDVRHDVRTLRRIVWPLRDSIDDLIRTPHELIQEDTLIHLRDCHDHAVQIIDALESFRDAGSDLRDYYATSISNRMNETIKVLTIISTLFMPLSFIAGVYGMNFRHMPELNWRFGYLGALALMAGVAAIQLMFFHRKGWLGRGKQGIAKANSRVRDAAQHDGPPTPNATG